VTKYCANQERKRARTPGTTDGALGESQLNKTFMGPNTYPSSTQSSQQLKPQSGLPAPSRRGGQLREIIENSLGLVIVLLLLIALFSFQTAHFFSVTTFEAIANEIPTAIFIAIGMTFVLIIGGIDLSVGSVLALGSGLLGVAIVQWHWPLWAAIGGCVLSGALCGLLNGFLTIRFRLPSFIVTLGLMEAARGATYLVTNSQTMYIGSTIEAVDNLTLFGLSLPFLVAIGFAIIAQCVLTGTVFGRYAIALGTSEEAVRLSGIDPRPIKLAVFTLSGALAATAGISYCAQLSSADPNAGNGFELAAIAAVVIGGTSLMGGRGSVINSLFGVLVIAVLETGLAQIGAQESVKRMVTGAVIIIAVIVDFYRTRRAAKK
jgi:ribose transport system permease protein